MTGTAGESNGAIEPFCVDSRITRHGSFTADLHIVVATMSTVHGTISIQCFLTAAIGFCAAITVV